MYNKMPVLAIAKKSRKTILQVILTWNTFRQESSTNHFKTMMRYTLFLIFLMAVTSNLVGQDFKTGQALSKEKVSNIAEYERLIKYYRYYKQDSAVYFAARAIGFARQQKDSNGVALILLQMGMIDDNKGEF